MRQFYPQILDGGSPSSNNESFIDLMAEFDDFEEGQHDQEVSRKNAEDFQQTDLQDLRLFFKEICLSFLKQIEDNDGKFVEEREFFLKQSLKD